jgi:beta-lactamase class A
MFMEWSLWVLSVLLSTPLTGNAYPPALPISIPDQQVRPLRDLVQPSLQQRFERELKRNRLWANLVARKKMAVGVVDLSDPYNIKFASVNGDEMMYAASLPKLAILLASAQALEDGRLPETPEVLNDMRIMISRSDNGAATRMMDRVGFANIVSVLIDPRYELYDTELGGLWVGKRYAKTSKRYPDPLMGLSHGATITQVCRFYYLLAMGKLVSPQRSRQMLEMLCNPEIHHKFVKTLDRVAPEAKVYRKSGTWRIWHSDSALVWGPGGRQYIIAALVEDSRGEQILRDLIPAIEAVLKPQSKNQQRAATAAQASMPPLDGLLQK